MQKNKIILIIFVLLFFFFIGFWSLLGCAPLDGCPWEKKQAKGDPKKVELSFYGVWDTREDWEDVFEAFNQYEISKNHLDVDIKYTRLEASNYEDILIDRWYNDESPNILMVFNSWLPKYKNRLVPMPEGYMTLKEFEETFAPIAKQDFVSDDEIYSLPLYVDTLGLYYNKDLFRSYGYFDTPENWNEFAEYVGNITSFDDKGDIDIMGATIGGGEKVDKSQDILMLLVMQNNASVYGFDKISSFTTPEAEKAISFYTGFADPNNRSFTWDQNNKAFSVDSFILGKAGMQINYPYEIVNIEEKMGGRLNYGTAVIPQQSDNAKVNYGRYWSPVVSKGASCKVEGDLKIDCSELAWEFIYFSSQRDNAISYLDNTGKASANLELAKIQADSSTSKIAPFAAQVITAKSWNNTYNKKTDQVIVDMIESIIAENEDEDEDDEETIKDAILKARGEAIELN